MGKKRPDRSARRERERSTKKTIALRQKAALLAPGGAPDRPIAVTSSSVIEPRVQSLHCPLCDGRYLVDEQTAPTVAGRSLRAVQVTCRLCGVRRAIYFAIEPPLLN